MSKPVVFHVITNVLLLLAISVRISNANKTTFISNSCSKVISGHYYNLKSLARSDGKPRFKAEKNNWNYGYNPCVPFSFQLPCEDVAACKWDQYEQSFTALALQSDVQWQTSKGRVELVFPQPKSQHWVTIIILQCDQSRKGVDDGHMSVVKDTSNPVLQIEHRCCCPDACPDVTPFPTPTPTPDIKTYSLTLEVIGGLLGILFVAVCIGYYCHRRNQNIRLLEEQGQLIEYPNPNYNAVEVRDPNDDASDTDGEDPDPGGEVSDPDGEVSDFDDEAPFPDDEPPFPDDEAPFSDDEAPLSDDEAPFPGDDEAPLPDNEVPDPGGEVFDPDGEVSDLDDEDPDLDNEDPHPNYEDEDPNGEALDSDIEAVGSDNMVSDPDGQAPDADDEASFSDNDASHLPNFGMRGESPHIANYVPHIRDEDLSHPIEVASSPEDQHCIAEPLAREPVEHSGSY